jgi:hypothetical protein
MFMRKNQCGHAARWLAIGACALTLPVAAGRALASLAAPAAVATGYLSPTNPFKTSAMRRFLATRAGNITAALFDVPSRSTFLYHPGDREQTASIVKVDILATLLAQAQARHEALDADDYAIATGMIEASDNDDATDLWDAEGGAPAVASLDARLRMTQTTPNDAWGLTETTPRDQLRLLSHVLLPHRLLRPRYSATALYLMEHVISFDYWGVTAGPSRGTTVAVKNGWLPVPGGWQINSIGMVRGHDRFYLIAVMTNGNPDEAYGIDTIEGISRIVWASLRDRRLPLPNRGSTGPSGGSGTSGATEASPRRGTRAYD